MVSFLPCCGWHLVDEGVQAVLPSGRRRLSGLRFACAAVYSTITRSWAPRPKVSGAYISSALGGGATKDPGVVAIAMYVYSQTPPWRIEAKASARSSRRFWCSYHG